MSLEKEFEEYAILVLDREEQGEMIEEMIAVAKGLSTSANLVGKAMSLAERTKNVELIEAIVDLRGELAKAKLDLTKATEKIGEVEKENQDLKKRIEEDEKTSEPPKDPLDEHKAKISQLSTSEIIKEADRILKKILPLADTIKNVERIGGMFGNSNSEAITLMFKGPLEGSKLLAIKKELLTRMPDDVKDSRPVDILFDEIYINMMEPKDIDQIVLELKNIAYCFSKIGD